MGDNTACSVCKTQNKIMKRCTRCHNVLYWECQVQDWKTHKHVCQNKLRTESAYTDDGSIFTENQQEKIEISHQPKIDFQKAFKEINKQPDKAQNLDAKTEDKLGEKSSESLENSYLFNNKYHSDLPSFDGDQPFQPITVRCNKDKLKLNIQNSWSGLDIFKVFSNKLKIPLDKIKVIHKGKVYTDDTICDVISKNAIFQVIGEQAANEDGLYKGDVDLLMLQMGIDRNEAVKALRKSKDVVDAIIELGNK